MVTPILPLTVVNAMIRRRGKTLIGPVDLTLENDGTTIVMGPNGSGKTTLLRMLHGLMRLREGSVTWNVPVQEARVAQSFVFQTPVVLRRSVRDNIAFPLLLRGINKTDAYAEAENWAQKIGLGDAVGRKAMTLSGGEKQKLALGRALIRSPQVLFLDEPTANLDGRSTREIEAILQEARKAGTRIVMATHNIGQAQRLASEVIFLYRGKVLERNQADRFFAGPKTEQANAFIKGDIVE